MGYASDTLYDEESLQTDVDWFGGLGLNEEEATDYILYMLSCQLDEAMQAKVEAYKTQRWGKAFLDWKENFTAEAYTCHVCGCQNPVVYNTRDGTAEDYCEEHSNTDQKLLLLEAEDEKIKSAASSSKRRH